MHHVLYIEDEVFFGDLLARQFAGSEIAVTVAHTGEEGLECMGREIFNLVLLDILLPGIDGFEVLRQLRAQERTVNTPVIILTNLDTKPDQLKAKDLGAQAFLVKSQTDLSEVEQLVKHMLEK